MVAAGAPKANGLAAAAAGAPNANPAAEEVGAAADAAPKVKPPPPLTDPVVDVVDSV